MSERIPVHEGGPNVFADLGLRNPEERLLKAQLAARISRLISERALTQTAAAAILCVGQPKVSALMRGDLAGFSVERLFRFLIALDQDVTVVVAEKSEPEARVRVQGMEVAAGSQSP